MAKVTISFEVPRKDGTRKVIFTLTHRGGRKRLPMYIEVQPKDLGKDRLGNLKIKSDVKRYEVEHELQVYNDRLFKMKKATAGLELTVDEVYQYITAIDKPEEIEFFSFADKWLEKADIKGKKNYITMLNSLEKHVGERYLPFSRINYTMLSDYSDSLKDRPRAQSLYLGAIRHIYKQAQLEYNTDTSMAVSPMLFERFKVPKQQLKGQRSIELEHLRRIIRYHGTGRAGLARDCFVLSFLTMGMNSADMYDGDARLVDGRICYRRKKVRDRRSDEAYIEVDVLPQAKALISKYRGKSRLFNFYTRYADEAQFNRAINIGLNKVEADINAQIIEENKGKNGKISPIHDLQFYQARHTWASIARNQLHIDKYTVNDALCHVDREMRTTDLYIKKDFSIINEANAKVIDFVLSEEQKGETGLKLD